MRRWLTAFAIGNNVAKYYAILPAMLVGACPGLAVRNIISLASSNSAILSAVLLRRNVAVYGLAHLIVPSFTNPGYLHPRPQPQATEPPPSGAFNLGPTNAFLIAGVAERRAAHTAENGADALIDAVTTTSASGLDPNSSPEPAAAQAARIATARNADPAAVQALIASQSKARLFGLYGEPLIKVLQPNLAQDAAFSCRNDHLNASDRTQSSQGPP